MSHLKLRSLYEPDYSAVEVVSSDMDSPLARCLLTVPQLSQAVSKADLKTLGLVSRSCYHAAARSPVWRDAFEIKLRHTTFGGPTAQTPSYLTHRDMHVALNHVLSRRTYPETTYRQLYVMMYHAQAMYMPDDEKRDGFLRFCQSDEDYLRRVAENHAWVARNRNALLVLHGLRTMRRFAVAAYGCARQFTMTSVLFVLSVVAFFKLRLSSSGQG